MGDEPFKVIVGAMGLTHADAAAVQAVLETRAAAGDLALFLDTADDPVVQRILTPRVSRSPWPSTWRSTSASTCWWSWPT